MKRIHIILFFSILSIAALLRWKTTRIEVQEAHLLHELTSLESTANSQTTLRSVPTGARSQSKISSRPQSQILQPKTVEEEFSKIVRTVMDPNAPKEVIEAHARMETAIAIGDATEAIRNFCLLPEEYQDGSTLAAIMRVIDTPEQIHSALTQTARSAENPLFSKLVAALAKKSTFETNLDLLARAEFTPEKHDLAAAIIAGSKIDDDTPLRAAWLFESLQTDLTPPITHFAQSWTEKDFKAANTWLESLPQGRKRDAAVAGFASTAARLDGASAVDWALTIADPAQRTSTLHAVAEIWKTREPAAAAAYLQDKGIEAQYKNPPAERP